jgi:hypothetical protein
MICTNVPGPQLPLYLLGHKMLRCYPYVPIGGEMGVNVAILSYDGTAYVGFGGDVHAVPDIDVLEEMLRASFAELREAAIGKPVPTKRAAVKPKVKRAARPVKPTTIKISSATKPKGRKPKVAAPAPKQPGRVAVATRAAGPIRPAREAVPSPGAVPEAALAHSGD